MSDCLSTNHCERSGDFRKWRTAETALAASQAQVREMHKALCVAERFIFDDTCRHDSEKTVPLDAIRAALARESGEEALREFGDVRAKAVVDAMLRGAK